MTTGRDRTGRAATPRRFGDPAARFVPVVLAIAFAQLAGAQVAADMPNGVSYRVRVSTEIRGAPDVAGKGAAPAGMFFLGRVSAIGNRARVDVQAMEPATGGFVAGDYILHTDTGAVVVHPDKSTYARFPATKPGAAGKAGAGAISGPMQMPAEQRSLNITGSRVVVQKLGRDSVEGRPVERYRVSYEYSVIIGAVPRTLQGENEIWASTAVRTPLLNPLAPRGTSVGMFMLPGDTIGLSPGLLRFARQMDSAMKIVEGVPIRTITTMNFGDAMGKAMPGTDQVLVQTTTFSAITPGTVDPARLEIPAGYTQATPAAKSTVLRAP
jgi:hypothetical protein